MLWEVIGLGAGSMPLTFRFSPMIGGILYWLRPGTVRQPPWPERVPLTRGSTRTVADVLLYAALLASGVYLLVGGDGGTPVRLEPAAVGVTLALLALLGLRDKLPFLAARSEVYGTLLVICLFPLDNLIVAAQLTFVAIWWGAASSKLNRHFPFVVSVMISNTPWNRFKSAKRRLYTDHPEDLRPSREGALTAHMGTVIEYTLPLLLLVSKGGTVGTIAVIGMVIFHVHILSTFPLAVPLEWNLFMIFGLLFLFGHYGDVPLSTLDNPLLIVILAVLLVGFPVLGNLRPDLISFLPAMRYYAGNWATSQWLFRKDTGAEETLDRQMIKPAPVVVEQVTKFYGRDMAELLLAKGLAFRSMHSHGRAINGLLHARGGRCRAVPRARGRADRGRGLRLQLRRRALPQPPAAGRGAGAVRLSARRRARDLPGVPAREPQDPALPDPGRRRRRGRGGGGRRGGHGLAPALAGRRAVPGARGPPRRARRREHRHRRRRRAPTAWPAPPRWPCAAWRSR